MTIRHLLIGFLLAGATAVAMPAGVPAGIVQQPIPQQPSEVSVTITPPSPSPSLSSSSDAGRVQRIHPMGGPGLAKVRPVQATSAYTRSVMTMGMPRWGA